MVKKIALPFRRRTLLRNRLKRLRLERGLRILPNLFTLGNAFFGFCSIICAGDGDFIAAAYFILLGALMDGLDGRIARYTKVTSDLGMQLDSLCDSISFCLAPAILFYCWQLKYTGGIGFLACVFFMLAGLLRLARFNITHSQQSSFFMGTPVTIAGCFLATIFLNTHTCQNKPHLIVLLILLVLTLAILMVSKIPFPTLKQLSKSAYTLIFSAAAAIVVVMGLTRVLLILFFAYFIFAFEEYLRVRFNALKKGPFHE